MVSQDRIARTAGRGLPLSAFFDFWGKGRLQPEILLQEERVGLDLGDAYYGSPPGRRGLHFKTPGKPAVLSRREIPEVGGEIDTTTRAETNETLEKQLLRIEGGAPKASLRLESDRYAVGATGNELVESDVFPLEKNHGDQTFYLGDIRKPSPETPLGPFDDLTLCRYVQLKTRSLDNQFEQRISRWTHSLEPEVIGPAIEEKPFDILTGFPAVVAALHAHDGLQCAKVLPFLREDQRNLRWLDPRCGIDVRKEDPMRDQDSEQHREESAFDG